jgi:hypothetical protein
MGSLLPKEELEALARSESVRKSVDVLAPIIEAGLREARRLIDGTSPDADVKLSECSTRGRFAMELTKQAMADRREEKVTERALGVIVLRGRMDAAEWEKHAADVDAGLDPTAIDVEAVEE